MGIAPFGFVVYNRAMSVRASIALASLVVLATRAQAQGRVVELGGDADSVLSDTTVARVWKSLCSGVAPKDSGIVYGVVRDVKTRSVVPGAYVDVVWTQLTVDKTNQIHERRLKLDTKADGRGVFGMCGIPIGQFLRIGAANAGRLSALVDLPPGERQVIRRDLMLGAERDSAERGMMYGTLRDVTSGGPLANARVIVDDSVEARTGNDGRFIVRGVATGTRQIEVLSIGMVPVVAAVDVYPNDSTPVTLSVRHVTSLDVVRVSASARARRIIDGLEDRKKLGGGYLLEAGDLYAHADISTVLQEFPGTQVYRNRIGEITVWTPAKNGALCQAEVWVDGAKSAQGVFPMLRMDQIVAVEMYPRPESVPLQYKNSAVQHACGAVLVWTTWAFAR